jgi:DnaJ-class molecular chaperone
LSKDFYNELNVDRGATQDDVKKAYFKLAKKYHPDVNKTPEAKERFSKINNAYETLSDDGKRRVYDQTGMTGDEQA